MRAAAKTLVLLATALAVPAGAAAAVAPYGKNDAGGFRNVLPPGEKGVGNALDLAAFTLDGTYPEHWVDQQPLYDGLLYAAAEPGFGAAEVREHYKDATFGVRATQVEAQVSPRPGVTIVRDSAYGVPHIYGETRADTMFGTGYAGAADRLFLMDILRHTGRAELSSFIGGSAGNRAMDRSQWQAAPYTDAELEAQAAAAPDLYGEQGERLLADLDAYIAGINDYISDALLNPTLLPAEYAALAKLPQPWTRGDVIATASLIGGIFGKGGGRELASAETLQALVERFGRKKGRRAWRDFRFKNDPETPTTVRDRFPYETTNPFAKRGLALPDRGSVEPAPVAAPLSRAERSASRPADPYGDIGRQLLDATGSGPSHASHWELIPGRESSTGRPIGVLGPQVGYYVPQVLMEMDVHGPGIDARGATFPGVNLYVLLGHGRDYAWSATSAGADNVDTFAEVLCQDDFHYRYKGECLPMERLDRHNAWLPNGVDMTPPGSETLTAYRTVHGIVYARGEVDGKQVAFASARSTYRHEADSALFFRRLNNPRSMRRGAAAFHDAAKKMNFVFNWSYLDDRDIAYELTGWYPQRARGVSTDFPVLGTGRFDWRGYDPETNLARWVPQRDHPNALNPRMLVSWNNKQAPGWSAADAQWGYGPIYRSEMLTDQIRREIRGSRQISLPELVKLQEQAATMDVRAAELLPTMLRALGKVRGELRDPVATLREWRRSGGFRRDLDKSGTYEHDAAVTLMDAWFPLLLEAEFRPALGEEAFGAVRGMVGFGAPGRGSPSAPAFSSGWYGYVSKDLRGLFGKRPRGAFSRSYCGRGSKAKCRRALRKSLAGALDVTHADLYAFGACEGDPQASCWDKNRPTVASAISHGPYPFQNRPTFQQTVSVKP